MIESFKVAAVSTNTNSFGLYGHIFIARSYPDYQRGEIVQQLTQLIEDRIESPEPQTTILNYLRSINGKRINKRHIDELRRLTGDDRIYLSKRYGMANIEWGGYGLSGGNKGGSLLIAYSEKNIEVDADWIKEKNPAYFDASVQRNERRQAVLKRPDLIEELAANIDIFQQAKANIEQLLDGPFEPDRYSIQDAFNLKDKR